MTDSYITNIVEGIMDYKRQIYAVADLREMIVVRAQRTEDGLKYKEIVCTGAPTKLTVYINPLGWLEKYEVTWEVPSRGEILKIGPAPIHDIINTLKIWGLVHSKALVKDVISTLFEGFIEKGMAEIREEMDSPGFYFVDDKLISSRWQVKEVSKEELKTALELLNELAQWYSHAIDRFAVVVKWGVISPFIFAMKQKGRWVPWLYLYGSSKTGKTTLGEIVLNIWGLGEEHRQPGAGIATTATFSYIVSRSTFPVLINFPLNTINKKEMTEIMINAIETTIVRKKHKPYTEIPSLAPLIMTSNDILPRDDELLRRFIVLRFTYGDRIEDEKAKQFEREVKPKLRKLQAIGQYIAKRILDNPKLLIEKEWNELATQLLRDMYNQAGLQPPEWINLIQFA